MLKFLLVSLVTAAGLAGCAGPTRPTDEHREQASEQQQPYFEDGVITFAEYEEAVLSTVSCVRADGFAIDARMMSDGFYQYGGMSAGGLNDALDACRELWSQLAYQESQGPSAEDLPAVRRVIACLSRAGHPPSGGSRPDQLIEFINRLPDASPARACADLVPAP